MIDFASPWLFLALPLPYIFRKVMPPANRSQSVALKVPFFKAISSLAKMSQYKQRRFNVKMLFAYIIWTLLVIALSGPQWLGQAVALPRSGRNIMLAIDLSQSMSLPDFTLKGQRYDRLAVVKKVAGEFIARREGDRVGLILFGTKAYMRTPLTFDLDNVKQSLEDSTIGLAGGMTAIGDAIGLAVKRLQDYPKNSRVLILLTDGASNTGALSPHQAAELAAKFNIKIYTIGIGADRLVEDTFFGPQVINPSMGLDEQTLKDIAKITHGEFFRAKNTSALKSIYQEIDRLEPINSESATYRPIHPLYPWPLGAAFILSLMILLSKILHFKQWTFPKKEVQPS